MDALDGREVFFFLSFLLLWSHHVVLDPIGSCCSRFFHVDLHGLRSSDRGEEGGISYDLFLRCLFACTFDSHFRYIFMRNNDLAHCSSPSLLDWPLLLCLLCTLGSVFCSAWAVIEKVDVAV